MAHTGANGWSAGVHRVPALQPLTLGHQMPLPLHNFVTDERLIILSRQRGEVEQLWQGFAAVRSAPPMLGSVDRRDGRRTCKTLLLVSHVGFVVKELPRDGPIKVIVLVAKCASCLILLLADLTTNPTRLRSFLKAWQHLWCIPNSRGPLHSTTTKSGELLIQSQLLVTQSKKISI
jgi:hypothetical protein